MGGEEVAGKCCLGKNSGRCGRARRGLIHAMWLRLRVSTKDKPGCKTRRIRKKIKR